MITCSLEAGQRFLEKNILCTRRQRARSPKELFSEYQGLLGASGSRVLLPLGPWRKCDVSTWAVQQ